MFSYFEWLLLLFPLVGTLLNGLIGGRYSHRARIAVASAALVCSMVVAMPLLAGQIMEAGLVGKPAPIRWIRVWTNERYIEGTVQLRIDALSVLMALAILSVGLCVHVYCAQRLQASDSHLTLSALGATLTASLLLVLAENMSTLLIGWSLTGWSTFWLLQTTGPTGTTSLAGKDVPSSQERQACPPTVSLTMPMFNLISDGCLLLATGLISLSFSSLSMEEIILFRPTNIVSALGSGTLAALALCLVASVLIRSAQFPFHIWLAKETTDARQPRTSSTAVVIMLALTAVPAGTYLLARLHPLLQEVPFVPPLLAWWGAGSALVMTFLAWIQLDGQKTIRYAALGQGGLLLATLGLGSGAAALAYLLAFVLLQALIFLAAGYATWRAPQDIRDRRAPGPLVADRATGTALAFGLLATTSIPSLPGFALARHMLSAGARVHWGLWILLALTIILVAAIAARALRTYGGEPRIPPSPSLPVAARITLSSLAFAAIVIGLLSLLPTSPIDRFVGSVVGMTPAEGHTDTHAAWWWFVIPPGLTVAGALLEHWANARQMHRHWALQRFAGGDAIQAMYRTLVVRPLLAAARLVAHWLEPGMARWTLGKFALLLDRTDGAQLKSSTSQATLYGPHRALLLSVIAVVVVLAFLLLTAFSRMR